ncbi:MULTISPECIES: TldD/PmbA family protein [unclassified Undibacterium]|uniref:TldD/PmbA family protein n=1 Tax=unclassified Undibacterium TaxID=2630295 RepID=UPI002AC89D4A|nr:MULTISPECIES: TldD/PmbA family protein [unclassified Undibacterium]MEB0137750.1 TldD/PmbA family protein [Undibacterium sp. CCC2.1]MEB0172808.1 TldD/PmbA family protein [Undibacterium sp. CCC1.1]MEB0176718.1 TldD/PmbA family protein [Undibacterium sp. CCC3.4]MEB0215956.1 TldD/PmbA family protein [Undibacterium sp. 5I2]WPX42325.1 TldD/PmbA family protein [Undibacterium sp. CCC3.4]
MDAIKKLFRELMPAVEFCSLRLVDENHEELLVRQNVLQPLHSKRSRGAMLSVIHRGGYGYAATSDLSRSGLGAALRRACDWASQSAARGVTDFSTLPQSSAQGRYQGPSASGLGRRDLIALLQQESQACRIDARIVDWQAAIARTSSRQMLCNSAGADLEQSFDYLIPSLSVSAHHDGDTQTRSLGGQYNGFCQQGGSEILSAAGLYGAGARVASEALALLAAPNCPSGVMDLLLMPEQMMLQIHESIGHPLELDRILGDERNFAGTSFVTADMFGHFQYGSALLNVTHDPSRAEQFASYHWDDEGHPAEKTWLIRAGVLERPLGSALSAARSGLPGLANARACDWNRPPIDRMANLNIEAGSSTLQEMIAAVEYGVLMNTNVSWSIDDSRNKFQFGCEYGQLIKHGELQGWLKNPNYRGISDSFWRSLKMVGDATTCAVMGTPYCGKGEPAQVIRVGHAAPACLFEQVEVFGGDA